jgi:hypothetical protein
MSFGNFLQFLNYRDFKRFRVKAYSPDIPTVFLHIPKTSGTALTLGLADAMLRETLCATAWVRYYLEVSKILVAWAAK